MFDTFSKGSNNKRPTVFFIIDLWRAENLTTSMQLLIHTAQQAIHGFTLFLGHMFSFEHTYK